MSARSDFGGSRGFFVASASLGVLLLLALSSIQSSASSSGSWDQPTYGADVHSSRSPAALGLRPVGLRHSGVHFEATKPRQCAAPQLAADASADTLDVQGAGVCPVLRKASGGLLEQQAYENELRMPHRLTLRGGKKGTPVMYEVTETVEEVMEPVDDDEEADAEEDEDDDEEDEDSEEASDEEDEDEEVSDDEDEDDEDDEDDEEEDDDDDDGDDESNEEGDEDDDDEGDEDDDEDDEDDDEEDEEDEEESDEESDEDEDDDEESEEDEEEEMDDDEEEEEREEQPRHKKKKSRSRH